jgi:hypothetical protein
MVVAVVGGGAGGGVVVVAVVAAAVAAAVDGGGGGGGGGGAEEGCDETGWDLYACGRADERGKRTGISQPLGKSWTERDDEQRRKQLAQIEKVILYFINY